MRKVRLSFHDDQLIELEYHGSTENDVRRSIRGKTCGAFRASGSFQWTSAVRALALFFLKARIAPEAVQLSGGSGSLAASLDYALSKQPSWLVEMFGADTQGISLARRFIFRTNPERKRPGPVVLSLNQSYLGAAGITVEINGVEVSGGEELRTLAAKIDCSASSEQPGLAAAIAEADREFTVIMGGQMNNLVSEPDLGSTSRIARIA